MKLVRYFMFRGVLVALCAVAGVVLGSASALAAGPFTSSGSFGKTSPVGGLLEEPRGVAVEASSGDVFVVSGKGENELQTVDLTGSEAGGSFTLKFEGQKTGSLAYGVNEKQTVTLTGASSGDFKLAFNHSAASAGIPYDATAAEVQAALAAVSTIKPGNVAVSGSAGGPYTVEFRGALKQELQPEMECTNETNGTCAVAIEVSGSRSAGTGEVEKALEKLSTIGPGNVKVFGNDNEYEVTFQGSLGYTNVEELKCVGSGPTCTVATVHNGFSTRQVVKYNAAGTSKLGAITGVETPQHGFEGNYGVAVDNSASACKGDVYVDQGSPKVDRFEPKLLEPNEYTFLAPQLVAGSNSQGVAVNSEGDLFASLWSFHEGISMFECGLTEDNRLYEHEPLTYEVGIAVYEATNDVYFVVESGGARSGENKVVKFNSSEEEQSIGELEEEAPKPVAVTVDQKTGEVFALDTAPADHVTRYNSAGAKLEEFGEGEISEGAGIAYSTQGNGRVYVTEKTNDAVHVFEGTAVVAEPYKTCATAGKETVEWKEGVPSHEIAKTKEVYIGEYENKECTMKDTTDNYRSKGSHPGPEGKYELDGFTSFHFEAKDGKKEEVEPGVFGTVDKTTTLTFSNGDSVTCKKLVTDGQITSATEASETMTMEKCETARNRSLPKFIPATQ